jgi:arginine decarboxylase
VGQQLSAGGGKPCPRSAAGDNGSPEHNAQTFQVVSDGRLAPAERAGGTSDGSVFGHASQRCELTEIKHDASFLAIEDSRNFSIPYRGRIGDNEPMTFTEPPEGHATDPAAASLAPGPLRPAAVGMPYADAVRRHAARDTLRLNVPGHSADHGAAPDLMDFYGDELLKRDITPLLDGLDTGPDSPLAQAQYLAAQAWGARRTWFLTNGASQANRIGALALGSFGRPDQPVIIQRSAHSSFIDGIILGGILPVFLQPTIDDRFGIAHGVSPAALKRALGGTPDPKGIYVITPSYFGAVADIAAMADIAHAAGVPLIVDAAWGAHFGFHPLLPQNPLALGADLVVSSTHKLGGSLTQSATLHLGDGPFADELEPLVQRAFMLTQSTSMSSLLLASLDIARFSLQAGAERIGTSIDSAERLRTAIRERGRFQIVSDSFGRFDDIVADDPLRVSIDVRSGGLDGHAVREELIRSAGIYTEISTDACIVAFIGPGHDPDLDRFLGALHGLDAMSTVALDANAIPLPRPGPLRLHPRDAWFAQAVTVPAAEAVGRVSTDSLSAYPPGIPNVLPGEVITTEAVDFLRQVAATPGGYVRGAADAAVDSFRVVAD